MKNDDQTAGPPPTEKPRTRLIFPLALIFTVFLASGSSLDVDVPTFPHKDKLIHFVVFGLIATLILRVTYNPARPWRSGIIAIVATSVYGVLDEFRQSFTPGRSVEVLDWVADTAGAIVAAVVYIYVPLWRRILEFQFSFRRRRPR